MPTPVLEAPYPLAFITVFDNGSENNGVPTVIWDHVQDEENSGLDKDDKEQIIEAIETDSTRSFTKMKEISGKETKSPDKL